MRQPRAGAGPAVSYVAAEAHQDAAACRLIHGSAGSVGRPGLRGRAEVELDSGGNPQRGARAVDFDRAPARAKAGPHGPRRRGRGGGGARLGAGALVEQAPVTALTGQLEGSAEGRIDIPVGQLGGAQGKLRSLAPAAVPRGRLRPACAFTRVNSESSRKRLQARSIRSSSCSTTRTGLGERFGLAHHQLDARAERLPACASEHPIGLLKTHRRPPARRIPAPARFPGSGRTRPARIPGPAPIVGSAGIPGRARILGSARILRRGRDSWPAPIPRRVPILRVGDSGVVRGSGVVPALGA